MHTARLWLLLFMLLISVLLLVSRYILPITSVTVQGNVHLSRGQVLSLANIQMNDPWLWVWLGQSASLGQEPWILHAKIIKTFPDKVEIMVQERVAVARLITTDPKTKQDTVQVIAADGTVLPGAIPKGLVIRGWGRDRLSEVLNAEYMLKKAGFRVIEVHYSPSGLRIFTSQGSLWCESLDTLQRYASSLKQYLGSNISIYPWGVSVQK